MPHLTWPSKSLPDPEPADLTPEAIIYPQGRGYPHAPPEDRLILGDNQRVMAALLPEYAGRIDLIYADPPFFTNKHYPTRIGRGEDSRRPQDWKLAEGYNDAWENLDDYLDFLYPRLRLMHDLLSPCGSLYLHLDWHASAYARLLLDEIFGRERLLNEIVWIYHGPSPIRHAFNRKHDTILAYTKSSDFTFNADAVRTPYHPNTVKTFEASSKAGFGKTPDLKRGKVPEDWWYFPVIARLHQERTGYPTQKPAALLERILLASSNPGELVADFFCGSGTTPLVASQLGRSFIAVDDAFRAVHTTRVRLIETAVRPFSIQTAIPLEPGRRLKNIRRSGRVISIDPELLPELDYWEVDPAWDGKLFRSAVQAVRPRNGQPIPAKLLLPSLPKDQPICVRLITINAARFQIELQPKSSKD